MASWRASKRVSLLPTFREGEIVLTFYASRADFDNEKALADYLRGYELLSSFFAKYL
jgi:hypothetical protein